MALLAAPGRTAVPFIRPGSPRGMWGYALSDRGVEAAAAAARRCPPGVPYSGVPFIAFVARRPMPGGQPDGFLTTHASTLHDVAARIAADARRCP